MDKKTVAIYTISKNESKHVDRFMDHLADADGVYVLDTGSTDNTVEMLKARGAYVSETIISPFRFDEARNQAMALVPDDIDVCFSVDLDEYPAPGWKELVLKAFNLDPTVTRLGYRHVWERDKDFNPVITFAQNKIHIRHGYHWINPIHEYLRRDDGLPEEFCDARFTELRVDHIPDLTKPRTNFYMSIMRREVEEHPDEPNGWFLLAREMMVQGQIDEAIKTLDTYFGLPDPWIEQRGTAWRYLGKLYMHRDMLQAEKFFLRATEVIPGTRDTWLDLALYYAMVKKWKLCYFAVSKALSLTQVWCDYPHERYTFSGLAENLAATAAMKLGHPKEALDFAEKACKIAPRNQAFRKTFDVIWKGLYTASVAER